MLRIRHVILMVCVPVFFTLHAEPLAADSCTSKIRIENIPGDAEFFINSKHCAPDEYGVIPVFPGKTLLEIKIDRVVVFSTAIAVDSGETCVVTLNCSDSCALLHILTEPSGAILSMNGTILGTTPFMNRLIQPGSYSIMVTSPGYIPVIRRLDLNPESEIESYILEQTPSVRDSLAASRKSFHRQQQFRHRIICSILGTGMIGAGAYYDWKAYTYLSKADEAGKAYDAASTLDECRKQEASYKQNRENADRPILYRNIFYAAAGLCLAGFYVSFIF